MMFRDGSLTMCLLIKPSYILYFLVLIAYICPKSSVYAESRIYYGDRYNQAYLGYGFDSSRLKPTKKCLIGSSEFHKKSKGKLDFIYNLKSQQLRERTYGEIHGGVNLFIFSGSVSTSIYHKTSTDAQSISNTVLFTYDAGVTTLENRTLPDNIEVAECGSGFIYQIDYGQDIYLNARLRFKTVEDYKRFITKIKIRILWKKKTKTKTKTLEKYAKNAIFTISVESNGELPKPLKQLIASENLTCRGDDIEPCVESYMALSNYLYSDVGLAKDIKPLPTPIRSITVRNFLESGHPEFIAEQAQPSPSLLKLLEVIEQTYGDLVQQEATAKALYDLSVTLEEKEKTLLVWNIAKEKRRDFAKVRSICFDDPNFLNCRQ